MALSLSQRALSTPASPIRKLSHLARKAAEEGRQIYHLNIGQPDLFTPPEFLEGLQRFRSDVVAYEVSEGNEGLRNAWTAYMRETIDLDISPDQILITMGASEALVFLFMTCCDPGDEVIIFDPTYANYIGFASIAGVKLSPLLSKLEENFALPSLESIEKKVSSRTKAILLCSPNNPTGTVYSREDIEGLLELCNKKDIFLVVDETYRELVYDNRKPLSVLHIDRDNPRVIVVDSLSKRFSLCGARIGCLITTNEEVLAKTLNLAQARLAAPTVEQHAAAYMLRNLPQDYLEKVRNEYQARRDVLYEELCRIDGVTVHCPGGAFYTVARLPVSDTEEFARFLLSDFQIGGESVFLSPAAGFYMENGLGANKVRLAYVLNPEDLRKALSIVAQGLDSFSRK